MRLSLSLVLVSAALLSSGCAVHHVSTTASPSQPAAATLAPAVALPPQAAPAPSVQSAPDLVNGSVREAVPNDYLRVTFLPATVRPVTNIGQPGAKRAFVTATPLFTPPLKLADLPAYSGLVNKDKLDLVAMRCRPPNPADVDAVLATWPNVFAAIGRDVPIQPDDCNPNQADAAILTACYAEAFKESSGGTVPTVLANTFNYAAPLFDSNHTKLATWLHDNYGIFPAFSGMGYSVKDSYYLDDQHPMTSQQILVKSISSEYILKNVALAVAGCRCIRVAPYTGRSDAPLDPEFIEQKGGDGTCAEVKTLGQ